MKFLRYKEERMGKTKATTLPRPDDPEPGVQIPEEDDVNESEQPEVVPEEEPKTPEPPPGEPVTEPPPPGPPVPEEPTPEEEEDKPDEAS
jgi:hypothetical protein